MNKILKNLCIKPSAFFIFSFLTAVFIFAIYPIFKEGIIYQYNYQDIDYHLLRIEGIKNELILHKFPIYIHSFLLDGYGYANSLCYPDLLLYIPAALRLTGFTVAQAYETFVVLITLFTIISTYYSAKYITKSRYTSLLCTILFVLSQYRLSNVFVRAAVGEYCAYIFIPIVIAGIYDFLKNDFKKPWIMGLAFLGLILTHCISFAIAVVITFIVLLFKIKYILKNIKLLVKLSLIALSVALLSCFYWLPMLEQLASQKFEFNNPWAFLSTQAVTSDKIFNYQYYASIGIPLLLFIIIRLFITSVPKNKLSIHRISDKALVAGIILVYMATNLFPWKYFDDTILNNIQFPWRLFAFASFLLALAAAINSDLFFKAKQRETVLIFIFITSVVFTLAFMTPMMEKFKYSDKVAEGESADYFSDPGNTYAIAAKEWLPLGTDMSKLKDSGNATDENGIKIPVERRGSTISFSTNGSQNTYYDAPLIYYKGYSAYIITESNTQIDLKIEKSPNNNVVRVLNPEKFAGKITVTYSGTPIQKISLITSVLSALTLLGIIILLRHKLKNQSAKTV